MTQVRARVDVLRVLVARLASELDRPDLVFRHREKALVTHDTGSDPAMRSVLTSMVARCRQLDCMP